MRYESSFVVPSSAMPGVTFTVRRVSVAARLDLLRKLRDLVNKTEFYRAGTRLDDRLEATIASVQIERLYIIWGITGISGLLIDGSEATPELLVERGPETLVQEAVRHVRTELGLTEEERKN
jgi:hypothetical protein